MNQLLETRKSIPLDDEFVNCALYESHLMLGLAASLDTVRV